MEENRESFHYTYSAQQQEEIKNIRKKYVAPEEDKMEQLRRLDRSAAKKGSTVALVIGVIGVLLLGIGMCCCMVWSEVYFIPGIVIGIIGIASVCCAYPLYIRVTEKERTRIAPEILRLSEELLK